MLIKFDRREKSSRLNIGRKNWVISSMSFHSNKHDREIIGKLISIVNIKKSTCNIYKGIGKIYIYIICKCNIFSMNLDISGS